MKPAVLILAAVLLAVVTLGRAGPRADALRSEGAAECRHGWSDAALGVAQPVERGCMARPAPAGAEESRGAGDVRGRFQIETTHPLRTVSHSTSFTSIDIFIDSAATPLAAYQLDFTATAPGDDEQSPSSVKIVGIEGGEPGPYNAAPYYDEHAIQTQRVIIGALSTLPADQLPRGKVRVARIHLMTTGAPHTTAPTCTLTLTTAAGADAQRIDAAASWQATPIDAAHEDQAEDQSERK